MLIEFFGMPGAGKTTLARSLADALRARGYAAELVTMDSPANLGRYAKLVPHLVETLPYVISHPLQACRAFALFRLFPQPSITAAASRLRYWWRTLALAEQSGRRSEVTILDQGIFQGLFSWALFCTRLEPPAVVAALRTVPRPRILILVTASEEARQARLRQRNYRHRRIDSLLLEDDRWRTRSSWVVALLERAAFDSDCHVVQVDSSPPDPDADLLERVLAILPANLRAR